MVMVHFHFSFFYFNVIKAFFIAGPSGKWERWEDAKSINMSSTINGKYICFFLSLGCGENQTGSRVTGSRIGFHAYSMFRSYLIIFFFYFRGCCYYWWCAATGIHQRRVRPFYRHHQGSRRFDVPGFNIADTVTEEDRISDSEADLEDTAPLLPSDSPLVISLRSTFC